METPHDDPFVRRAARWFDATPLELVGLAVLLAGALAASVALWWSATARPDRLPATPGSEIAGLEGPASGSLDAATGDAGAEDEGGPPGATDGVGTVSGEAGSAAAAGTHADEAPAEAGLGESGQPAEFTVHVTGAVHQPGLVVVGGAARVGDAVAAAGGLTDDAAQERVNLARFLTDGEHVHVPRIGEDPLPVQPGSGPTAGSADGAAAPGSSSADARIDLNTASAERLQALPGIGPAKADAIVRHREANGPFTVPGDLRAVPGIGEATFQRLADLVTVG